MKKFYLGILVSLIFVGTASAEPVRIGVLVPQTGVGALVAKHGRAAIEVAIDQLGGKIGGQPLEVKWGDTQTKVDVAKQLADEMVKSFRADFIVGPSFSSNMMAVHGPITRSGTFLISPVSAPGPLVGAKCSENYFNTSSQNDAQAEAMGVYLQNQGIKKVYFMTANYQAGKDMFIGFKRYYKGEIVGEVYTRFGQVDFAPELSTLREAKPEATFVFYPGGMGVQYVRQYAQAGLMKSIPLYTVWTVDQGSLPAIGDDAIGVRGTNVWNIDHKNETNQRFVKDFKAKTGFLPSDYAAHHYDAIMLIDSAVRAVKGNVSDKDAVRNALRKADFKSNRDGPFSFNVNHVPIENLYVREVEKNAEGVLVMKSVATVMENMKDSYYQDCKMAK
jgi:branched-chain amino acid transport system substrate-binding protein